MSDYLEKTERHNDPLDLPPFEDYMVSKGKGRLRTEDDLVKFSNYQKYIKEWFDVFPKEQMLVRQRN